MEVEDIVKEVATLLQLSNVLELDFDDAEDMASVDETTQRDIDLVVSCLNQTLTRIATEYVELLERENITVENGQFDLSTLTKDFCKVKSIGGKKFEVVGTKLVAENGEYEILYSYLPEKFEFDDEVDIFENLSKFAIFYGICSEFCMILGDFSQSEAWESKFENAMESAKTNLKTANLKQRRWR